ncbi:MAG: N-acetylmuramoyl-L-alanine amidase [Betaproteobacteria bacterium]|nr:N-acetylmuramoyl-L-alanine amidase [Betaproteobacteria bacterium]
MLLCVARTAVAAEVAVDVGHSLEKPGVISAGGVPEFEFNRALAFELRDSLAATGTRVRMIGERGDFAGLHARSRAAHGADLFVSIHHDSVRARYLRVAEKFAGFSLFVSRLNPKIEKSLVCASAIGAALRGAGFTASRYHADPVLGESRPFADEVNGVHYFDNLAVAKTATMAAVLVEAGVIVNREEEARLAAPAIRQTIAAAIAEGVSRCLH